MPESLRQIKSRIRSIQNIDKVSTAMEMIAMAKSRSLLAQRHVLQRYFNKLEEFFFNIARGHTENAIQYFRKSTGQPVRTLYVVTSDAGLCGAYNVNIIHRAEAFLAENPSAALVTVGRKGAQYFKRRGLSPAKAYDDLHGRYDLEKIDGITQDMLNRFLASENEEIYAVYAHYESASRHAPVVIKILNLEIPAGRPLEMLAEPDPDALIAETAPLYIKNQMRMLFLSAFLSEHSARAIAMGEASDNADELLDDLILLRNKIRQAGITKEIIEIISSADALKG